MRSVYLIEPDATYQFLSADLDRFVTFEDIYSNGHATDVNFYIATPSAPRGDFMGIVGVGLACPVALLSEHPHARIDRDCDLAAIRIEGESEAYVALRPRTVLDRSHSFRAAAFGHPLQFQPESIDNAGLFRVDGMAAIYAATVPGNLGTRTFVAACAQMSGLRMTKVWEGT
jgi:hypothetical protein